MPIPNKENIYYLQVRDGSPQDFVHRMVKKLRENNIRVIDLATAYEQSRDQKPEQLLYFTDDAHWNPYGVELAAELLAEEIQSNPGK